jgi:hypothetical protein
MERHSQLNLPHQQFSLHQAHHNCHHQVLLFINQLITVLKLHQELLQQRMEEQLYSHTLKLLMELRQLPMTLKEHHQDMLPLLPSQLPTVELHNIPLHHLRLKPDQVELQPSFTRPPHWEAPKLLLNQHQSIVQETMLPMNSLLLKKEELILLLHQPTEPTWEELQLMFQVKPMELRLHTLLPHLQFHTQLTEVLFHSHTSQMHLVKSKPLPTSLHTLTEPTLLMSEHQLAMVMNHTQ